MKYAITSIAPGIMPQQSINIKYNISDQQLQINIAADTVTIGAAAALLAKRFNEMLALQTQQQQKLILSVIQEVVDNEEN